MEPIAYTYEASEHCPACATERFGICSHGFIAHCVLDAEGNEPGAVFDHFEGREMACGTCGEEI